MSDLGADPLRSVASFRSIDPSGRASVELTGPTTVVPGRVDPAGHALGSVLPGLRPTARELRVVDLATPEHVPWPPVRSNGRGCDRSSAAVVTVVSLIAGELWTEELTLAIGSVDTPDGEVSIVAPGLSLRAPSAELAGWRPLLDPIRASFSVNPSWLAGRR